MVFFFCFVLFWWKAGQSLSDVLPRDLYVRLKRHLNYVKHAMPSWMSPDQRGRGLYADYLFSAITGNWERKRPIWVMLMVNSLTESDVKSRGIPVLDLYLAQEAERRNKRMGAVERVDEQCVPLNGLNFSQVLTLWPPSDWHTEEFHWHLSLIISIQRLSLVWHLLNNSCGHVRATFNHSVSIFIVCRMDLIHYNKEIMIITIMAVT